MENLEIQTGGKEGSFTLYPAIDLRGGKVVRLRQGDPNLQTTYADDPGEVAKRWFSEGARWLHVVNLDGAFSGKGQTHAESGVESAIESAVDSAQNMEALQAIMDVAKASDGQIQFGGGVRTLEDIEQAIEMGVNRVLLGTIAVDSPGIVQAALEHFGSDHIAVALDARDGQIRVRGWKEGTGIPAVELGSDMYALGIRRVIYTNIARDGMGSGADVEGSIKLAQQTRLSVIVSGGVKSLNDVRSAKKAAMDGNGIDGIIIGRALYDGFVILAEAIKC